MLVITVNNTVHTVRYTITYAKCRTYLCLHLPVNNTILLHFWLDANCISLAWYLYST